LVSTPLTAFVDARERFTTSEGPVRYLRGAMLSVALWAVLAGSGEIAVVDVAAATASAPSDDVEARANALVREGRLDEAFELLEQAYYAAARPEPRLLFGMGVIELERGNCETAVGYLGRFLATSPAEGAAGKAREVIAYCEQELRAGAEPDPAPETGAELAPGPAPAPAPRSSTEASTRREPAPAEPKPRSRAAAGEDGDDTGGDAGERPGSRSSAWVRDGLGWGLLGTGVAVSAAGVGLLVQARSDVRAAEASLDEASFHHSLARVDTLRIVGGTLTGVGVSLLVGAVIRYGLVARRERRGSSGASARSWLRTSVRF